MLGNYILYVSRSGKFKTVPLNVDGTGFKISYPINEDYIIIAVFVNFIRVNAVIERSEVNEVTDAEYIQSSIINNLYFSMMDLIDFHVYNPAFTQINVVEVVQNVPYASTKSQAGIFTKQFNNTFN